MLLFLSVCLNVGVARGMEGATLQDDNANQRERLEVEKEEELQQNIRVKYNIHKVKDRANKLG